MSKDVLLARFIQGRTLVTVEVSRVLLLCEHFVDLVKGYAFIIILIVEFNNHLIVLYIL